MIEVVVGIIVAAALFVIGLVQGGNRERGKVARRGLSARREKDALIREVTDDVEIIELLVDPDDRR